MNKRIEELDVLRGAAILGVILIHITSTALDYVMDGTFAYIITLFMNQATRFAVPTFLFLSGLGLSLSNKLKYGYFAFLKSQLSKILLLYLLWSFIYHVFSRGAFNLVDFTTGLVLGNNYYHLYYVPLIIFLYVIYPLLVKVGKSRIGLLSTLGVSVISQLADLITGLSIFNHPLNIFNWLFYFVFGIWVAFNIESKMKKVKTNKKIILKVAVSSVVLVFIESYFLINTIGKDLATTTMRPSIIVFSVISIFAVLCIDWKETPFKKTSIVLSKLSYGIYLSHAFILSVFDEYFGSLFTQEPVLYILMAFLIVTLISIGITIILDKILSAKDKNFKQVAKNKS